MAWIPDVNPSELIESAWGNTIRDHVVNTFASVAERSAAIPAPTAGMVSYLADSGRVEVYTAKTTPSSWRPPWGTPWGQLAYVEMTVASGTVSQTPLVLPGMSLGPVALVAGRRIRVTSYAWTMQVTGGPSHINVYLYLNGAQVALSKAVVDTANHQEGIIVQRIFTSTAGNFTFDTYLSTDVGTAQVSATPSAPSFMLVEDIGGV